MATIYSSVLTILAAIPPPFDSHVVPSGFVGYHVPQIGLVNNSVAVAHCHSLGGTLAVMKNQEQHEFVKGIGCMNL